MSFCLTANERLGGRSHPQNRKPRAKPPSGVNRCVNKTIPAVFCVPELELAGPC